LVAAWLCGIPGGDRKLDHVEGWRVVRHVAAEPDSCPVAAKKRFASSMSVIFPAAGSSLTSYSVHPGFGS
jgi:hypothetical protein